MTPGHAKTTNPRAATAWLLGAAALALTACSSLQSMLGSAPKPSASLKDVTFKSVTLTSVTLQFDVEVTNPYDVALPLVNLDYRLSAGESRLLKGVADTLGAVPAHQAKIVTLPVVVAFDDVYNFARGARSGTPIPYVADVKLGVDAPALGRITVPMSKNGEITLPSVPGF